MNLKVKFVKKSDDLESGFYDVFFPEYIITIKIDSSDCMKERASMDDLACRFAEQVANDLNFKNPKVELEN